MVRSCLRCLSSAPLAAAGGAAAAVARCETSSSEVVVARHPVMKHGVPESSYTVASDSFVVSFDYRTRNPHWVVERLTHDSVIRDAVRKRDNFHEVKEIPKVMRNRLEDFAGSGYDRGHLAAAANHTGRGFHDTFSLANVSPQVGRGFNRDYWARFEKLVRDLVLSGDVDQVTVATGPLFLRPTKKLNGRILIPSHFYKIVLAETLPRSPWSGAGYAVAAFVVPNREIEPDTPITNFIVPLQDLEAASGVIHFPTLLTPHRREALQAHEQKWINTNTDRTRQPLLPSTTTTASHKKGGVVGGGGHRQEREKGARDMVHLCDRAKCDLVSVKKWLSHVRGGSSSSS